MNIEQTLGLPQAGHPPIRTVAVTRSATWLGAAFQLFLKTPLNWALATTIVLAIAILFSLAVPGWLAFALCAAFGTVVTGRLMRTCQALDAGRTMPVRARRATPGQLWTLALMAAAMCVALSAAVQLLGAGAIDITPHDPAPLLRALDWKHALIGAAAVLVSMALWLAPALVVLHGVPPLQAVRMSLLGSAQNIAAYAAYHALALLLLAATALTYYGGLLILIPMLICGSYLACKDMVAA